MKKYKKYFIITLMLAFVFSFSFTSLPVSAASKYGTYGRRTYYYTVSKAKNITIPMYSNLVYTISNALEEKEREEFTRLKVIKRMKS